MTESKTINLQQHELLEQKLEREERLVLDLKEQCHKFSLQVKQLEDLVDKKEQDKRKAYTEIKSLQQLIEEIELVVKELRDSLESKKRTISKQEEEMHSLREGNRVHDERVEVK